MNVAVEAVGVADRLVGVAVAVDSAGFGMMVDDVGRAGADHSWKGGRRNLHSSGTSSRGEFVMKDSRYCVGG